MIAYCDILEMRLEAAEAADGDPGETVRGALCDLAVTMTGTRRDASVVHDVAERLHRMPLTALRFVTGSFDWSTVITITSVLRRASDETISKIEYEVCAAGGRMRPQALRNRIWRLWMKADPDGAAQARETAKSEEVGVRIDRAGPGGISSLIAKITDLESAEADALIVEIVGTVCKDDPRSTGMLRAAGLMALLHGEHSLVCQCDLGDDCPVAGAADDLPPRRGHLLQIVVAVETLLGLSSEPATSADGTPIDPEVARIVAADAKWQAMLTELVEMLKPEQDKPEQGRHDQDRHEQRSPTRKNPNDNSPDDDTPNNDTPNNDTRVDDSPNGDDPDDNNNPDDADPDGDDPDDNGLDDNGLDDEGPDDPDDEGPDDEPDDEGPADPDGDGPGGSDDDGPGDEGGGSTGGDDPDDGRGPAIKGSNRCADPLNQDDPENPDDPAGQSPPGFCLLRTVLGIGRVRSAAQLPPVRGTCAQDCPPADQIPGEESVRDGLVARWLGWIAEQPERARGIFPDGHGGQCVPSRAAVTYRPSARVAAFVRTAYRTCTFPHCDVPSARCQIDHLVPFDKDDPRRGGWTIVTNLQPVCVFHHQAKTSKAWSAVMLAGGSILWSNSVGLRAVTLPEFSTTCSPRRRRRRKKSADNAPSPLEPTRWELEFSGSVPPTLADFRSASSDTERKELAEKRRAYLEHCRVVHIRIRLDRSRYDPAPF